MRFDPPDPQVEHLRLAAEVEASQETPTRTLSQSIITSEIVPPAAIGSFTICATIWLARRVWNPGPASSSTREFPSHLILSDLTGVAGAAALRGIRRH